MVPWSKGISTKGHDSIRFILPRRVSNKHIHSLIQWLNIYVASDNGFPKSFCKHINLMSCTCKALQSHNVYALNNAFTWNFHLTIFDSAPDVCLHTLRCCAVGNCSTDTFPKGQHAKGNPESGKLIPTCLGSLNKWGPNWFHPNLVFIVSLL